MGGEGGVLLVEARAVATSDKGGYRERTGMHADMRAYVRVQRTSGMTHEKAQISCLLTVDGHGYAGIRMQGFSCSARGRRKREGR